AAPRPRKPKARRAAPARPEQCGLRGPSAPDRSYPPFAQHTPTKQSLPPPQQQPNASSTWTPLYNPRENALQSRLRPWEYKTVITSWPSSLLDGDANELPKCNR